MRHLGSILICFHPSSAGSQCQCKKPLQLWSEIRSALLMKVTRCHGFTRKASPGRGIFRPPNCQSPLCRWPTWRSRPSAVAWEMPIGQTCCRQQKTKSLASHAAGYKRERAREQPRRGPSGTMAILSGASEGRLDKGAHCPQTPAAASAQNRGVQICRLGSANAESGHTPLHVTLPPSAISARSLESQETIYCRLI